MSGSNEKKRGIPHSRHITPVLKIALLLGVLVHFIGFFFFRVVSNPLPSQVEHAAFITLLPTEAESGEVEFIGQASLFDSAPLFIPGEWSAVSRVFFTELAPQRQVFPDFEPDINLPDEVRPTRLSLLQRADVSQPSDLLDLRFWDLFSAFGEKDSTQEQADEWRSTALITKVNGPDWTPGEPIAVLETDLGSEEFGVRPLTLFMHLSAPGILLGAPVIEQSSGSDLLDAAVLDWLTSPATLANLPSGFLELRVFP